MGSSQSRPKPKEYLSISMHESYGVTLVHTSPHDKGDKSDEKFLWRCNHTSVLYKPLLHMEPYSMVQIAGAGLNKDTERVFDAVVLRQRAALLQLDMVNCELSPTLVRFIEMHRPAVITVDNWCRSENHELISRFVNVAQTYTFAASALLWAGLAITVSDTARNIHMEISGDATTMMIAYTFKLRGLRPTRQVVHININSAGRSSLYALLRAAEMAGCRVVLHSGYECKTSAVCATNSIDARCKVRILHEVFAPGRDGRQPPITEFLRRDGDHAIATRVIEMMAEIF